MQMCVDGDQRCNRDERAAEQVAGNVEVRVEEPTRSEQPDARHRAGEPPRGAVSRQLGVLR